MGIVVWLERELVVAVHDRQLAEHGGSVGIRDEHLLASALARPQQLFAYGNPPPDLADLAASLTYGLARNHAFVDANKRTAILSCELFIELNDGELLASDVDIYPQILSLAQGQLSEADFASWLRANIRNTAEQINKTAAAYTST